MRIKSFIEEDFINYKQPSMFLGTCACDWKCAKDGNFDISICQNSHLAQSQIFELSNEEIYKRYNNNLITNSIVIGGLEPILQFNEVYDLIYQFRQHNCKDMFIIYTGYNKSEIIDKVNKLKKFKNIIIKFGRFIPNQEKHYDNVLGVKLASDNQYAEQIS